MKKINQYLPFILWSIATIILTIIAFIFIPIIMLYNKAKTLFRKNRATSVQKHIDCNDMYAFSSTGFKI